MPRIGRLPRDTGVYLTLLIFIGLEMGYMVGDQKQALAALVSAMSGILCWIVLKQKKIMSGTGFPVFAVLLSGQFFFFICALQVEFYFYIVLLALVPILIERYLKKARQKYMPGTGSIVIMVSGFIISIIYQTVVHRGTYEYLLASDFSFLLALSVYFITYQLLVLNIISIRQILIALTLSVLPLVLYAVYASGKQGELSLLLTERFGANSGHYSANYLAQMFDFCFPFALFLALGEKKTYLKIFFIILSTVYYLCMLLTSSRGSVPGILAVPLFFLFRSRSIIVWVAVATLTIGILGTFGGRVEERILKPTRSDSFSNMGRVELAKAAHSILNENHYIFGIGIDNFRREKLHYGFPVFFDAKGNMSSHNTFLEFWLGWGLLGILGWIGLLIGSFIRVMTTKLQVGNNYLKYALIFALCSFIVHSLFDSAISYFTFMVLIVSTLSCMSFLPRLDIRNSGGDRILSTRPD